MHKHSKCGSASFNGYNVDQLHVLDIGACDLDK